MRPQKPPVERRPIDRLTLPEDVLSYVLSEYLRSGREKLEPEWEKYMQPDGTFSGGAASANHKGMAATCALAANRPAGRSYWRGRFDDELRGKQFGLGEPLGRYGPWSAGAVALVAILDPELRPDAMSYLRAYAALLSLGAAPGPAERVEPGSLRVGRARWDGVVVAGVGVRQDPGHLDGDVRAMQLQALLGVAARHNAPLANFLRNVRDKAWMTEPLNEREIRRRKVVSQLWELRALEAAIDKKFGLKPKEQEACLAWIHSGERLEDVLGLLRDTRTPVTLQFLRWADGRRAVWIDGSHGERNIWWSLWTPADGVLTVGFPYSKGKLSQSGGKCTRIGNELVATSRSGDEARTSLPDEMPAHAISVGPEGVSRSMP